jgi:DNA-binding MarR family transcriptional regulator
MHRVFFSVKRVHLRIVEVSKRLVTRFGLTPARFDMMRILLVHAPAGVAQAKIRALLGVSAATVSRMLVSLEKLGFIVRDRWAYDARCLIVELTELGKQRVTDATAALVEPPNGVAKAERMAQRGVDFEPKVAVPRLRVLQRALASMRRTYGDDAAFTDPWRTESLDPYYVTTLVEGRIVYGADIAARKVRYGDEYDAAV